MTFLSIFGHLMKWYSVYSIIRRRYKDFRAIVVVDIADSTTKTDDKILAFLDKIFMV